MLAGAHHSDAAECSLAHASYNAKHAVSHLAVDALPLSRRLPPILLAVGAASVTVELSDMLAAGAMGAGACAALLASKEAQREQRMESY